LIKNSQPFGKKFQKTAGGDFFDSHCTHTILCKRQRQHFYTECHTLSNDHRFRRLYLSGV